MRLVITPSEQTSRRKGAQQTTPTDTSGTGAPGVTMHKLFGATQPAHQQQLPMTSL